MAGTLGTIPYFDPRLEVEAHKIPELDLTDSRRHVAVVVNMSWPLRSEGDITKYSVIAKTRQTALQFDVDFSGNVELKLNSHVLICLRGAQISLRPPSGRHRIPFKLEFMDGFMIKLADRILDTFPEEEPSASNLPAWFNSQPPRQSDPPSPQSSAKSEAASSPPRIQSDVPPTTLQTHKPTAVIYRPNFSPAEPSSFHRSIAHHPPVTRAKSQDKRPLPSDTAPSLLAPRSSSNQRTTPSSAKTADQSDPSKGVSEVRPKKRRRGRGKKSHAEPVRNPALDMVAGFYSNLVGPIVPLANAADKVGSKVSLMDWTATLELLDPSVTEQTALTVTLFLPSSLENCMPNVKAGDVIMLVKIAIVSFNGTFRGTGYPDTFQWAGYSLSQNTHFHSVHRDFSDLDHCPFFTPGPDELQYASQLAEWWKALQELAKTKPDGVPTLMAGPRGRQLITLSEAEADVFFNCVVEILFKVPPGDQAAEIFVTDYTVHPQFYPRQLRDETRTTKQEQIKVYGRRVLKVMLWGSTQIEHSRELDVGYYYIDNLRVKFDSKGNLEGTLQDDRRKIDKLRKDDPLLGDLLKRKSEYFGRAPSPDASTSRVGFARGQDPNLHSAGDLLPPPAAPVVPTVSASAIPSVPKQAQTTSGGDKPSITRLLYYNIVQTPIQQVLGHGSCPEIFRIRARVAAFEPYKLANFTHGFCTKCKADFVPGATACVECGDFEGEFVGYEYRFRLCVEEEAPRPSQDAYRASLILDVSGKDAEMFLSGVPPQDFHNVANARKLRNRLTPAFGNLEAYQCDLAAGNSAKALVRGQYFDMLVQSYRSATKSEGSLDNKRYKLWGTELLANASK
ncbi:hypothetical protein FRC07_000264 [Ceratobasidium sp. 392]|nr:hypothetical protein FRC07_000264 [Ceratobasidium sp. 392]